MPLNRVSPEYQKKEMVSRGAPEKLSAYQQQQQHTPNSAIRNRYICLISNSGNAAPELRCHMGWHLIRIMKGEIKESYTSKLEYQIGFLEQRHSMFSIGRTF
jgi:hypothetical protein